MERTCDSSTIGAASQPVVNDPHQHQLPHGHQQQQQQQMEQQQEHAVFNDAVLSTVFAFVAPLEHLFTAAVCRRWRSLYRHCHLLRGKSPAHRVTDKCGPYFTCLTSYQNATGSISRLAMAFELCGMAAAIERELRSGGGYATCNSSETATLGWRAFAKIAGGIASREVLQQAAQHGMPWCPEICAGAAAARRFELVKWLHGQQGCSLSLSVACYAAEAGDIAMLEWVMQQPTGPWPAERNSSVAHAAAKGGHLAMLEHLARDHAFPEADVYFGALYSRRVKCVQWFLSQFHCDATTIASAAHTGSFEVFKLVHDHFCGGEVPCAGVTDAARGREICVAAVHTGSAEMLSFCLEHRLGTWSDAEFLRLLLKRAGMRGHIEACKVLRALGAPWPINGAVNEHSLYSTGVVWPLNTLQWALAEGCEYGPWTSQICRRIAHEWENHEQLHWIHKNGCPVTVHDHTSCHPGGASGNTKDRCVHT